MRTGRLILPTTWLLLSTAGSSLHTAWRHVSSLNFIYPSRAALPPIFIFPCLNSAELCSGFFSEVSLHQTTNDRSGRTNTHREYSSDLSRAAFVFSPGLRVQTDVACLMAMASFHSDIRGPEQGERLLPVRV